MVVESTNQHRRDIETQNFIGKRRFTSLVEGYRVSTYSYLCDILFSDVVKHI